MFRIVCRVCGLVALLATFGFLTIVPYVHAQEFSADVIIINQAQRLDGKVFIKHGNIRQEINTPVGKSVHIVKIDEKVMWMLMPREKMYVEMPLDLRSAMAKEVPGEMERELVGSGTVSGHPTEKYKITYTHDGRTYSCYQWLATDINFPIRTAAVDGSWSQEYRNIKMEKQPDSLFELPGDYKKFAMPGMP